MTRSGQVAGGSLWSCSGATPRPIGSQAQEGGADPVSGLSALLSRRQSKARPGRVRDAIVLSGGGSLGAAQVGALRALFEAGVRPDLVVGCSVGALNGAFLSVSPTLERVVELEEIW